MNELPRAPLVVLALVPLALTACSSPARPYVSNPTSDAYGGSGPLGAEPSPADTFAPPRERLAEGRDVDRPYGGGEVGTETPAPPPRFEGAPTGTMPDAEESWGSSAASPRPAVPPASRAHGAAAEDGSARRFDEAEAAPEAKSARGLGGHGYRKPQPDYRPGLATEWGEARYSHVTSAPFQRASESAPFASGKLFYNDPRGIDAMSGGSRSANRSTFPLGAGHVEVGLRTESGGFFTGFSVGADHFVPAHAGQRYVIVVKNRSPGRIEIVASVDGLDVIDGRPAAFAKRGYLIDPHGEVEIEGFRTSTSAVASFRFGSVASSYAAKKHGDTRNVGVIGVAAFHERGDSPWHWPSPYAEPRPYPYPYYPDAGRRLDADPFPQRFAAPPR